MKIQLTVIAIALCMAITLNTTAQTVSFNPGIWQTFGAPMSLIQYPELRGRLSNFRWKDIELSDNNWSWAAFDSDLTSRTADGAPVTFMIYTKEDAPDWIYDKGVPKVTEKDSKGNVVGYSPYFADPLYKSLFQRMIQKVHAHIETLPANVRNNIVGVQGCYGSTGDYISYKGTVPDQYYLDGNQFFALFQEFSQYYYDEYKNTNPKIYLLSNPRNQGEDQAQWVVANCPGWIKTATLGKGYQLNDEKDKYAWLYDMINKPQSNGDYIRSRSEMIGGNLQSGWWKKVPYQNMFTVMCYDIFWGLDWNNQASAQIDDVLNDPAFEFFNKYAGQKKASQATNAMCALKDALDAADDVRFPPATYGTVSRTNKQRYTSIANKFAAYGAKEEDVTAATLNETDNIVAKGINDVGWNIFSGNYDRYLHQLVANQTSAGYWNVASLNPLSMYGRFARGFDIANNKKGLYFDVDDSFLNNVPLNGKYAVTIEVTYLDKGLGSWKLYYDSKTGTDVAAKTITCLNTNLWKTAKIVLNDAYFGNRAPNASDFSIRSGNNQNIMFSVVELSRASNFASKAAAVQSIATDPVVSKSTAVNNAAATLTLTINPNPVQDQFYVELKNTEIKELIIYNQFGLQVLHKQVSGSRILLRKQEVGNAGIYYIKVFTNTGWFTGKLLVL
ncbi:hypothetical protein BH11BAC6_BH11BAC6_15570 [soil metagenome]